MTGSPPRMRYIGLWMRSIMDDGLFPPQEFVREQGPELRSKVADYLDRGQILWEYRGHEQCWICDFETSAHQLTDGYWCWTPVLAHYIREHGVVLPEEFNDHVLSGIQPVPPAPEWRSELPDETFWRAWGTRNVSPRFLDRLARIRAETVAYDESRLAAAVAECEKTKGLSEKKCQWRDCNNRAMVGKPICCRCSLRNRTSMPEPFLRGLYFSAVRGLIQRKDEP